MFPTKIALIVIIGALLANCGSSVPSGVTPVSPFDINRYLGNWYEIARLDHSFERGLQQVTANYSFNDDGTVQVINRGYSSDKQKWNEAKGKAKFADNPDTGFLKVSFFGPFYASYVIAVLDENYNYALVTGPNRKFLWILSRTPTLPDRTLNELVEKAKSLGFDTNSLIYVTQ
jgi:apolipoprotein D and lipocalin family protein